MIKGVTNTSMIKLIKQVGEKDENKVNEELQLGVAPFGTATRLHANNQTHRQSGLTAIYYRSYRYKMYQK